MSKKRNKKNRYFNQKSSVSAFPAVGTAAAVMEMPAGFQEVPEYIPAEPEEELTPEQEAELLAELRNEPYSYPTDEEIAQFQAEYPSEPSCDNDEEADNLPCAVIAMNSIFKAVDELNDSDFTDTNLALSRKAEEIAGYGRQAFILHDEAGNEIVNLDMVYEFNQASLRTPAKYGILSVLVIKNGNADVGWEENWQSIDILMVEKELWETAHHIEDFSWCIPVANKGMTTAEMFADTRKRYAETCLA